MTKDQTSLGSQFQYLPQAASAQMAPAITVKVHSGNATTCSRYAERSRSTEVGRASMNRPRRGSFPAARCCSRRSCTNCSTEVEKPRVNRADDTNATDTWMTSQKLCSAGTSWAAWV